MEYTDRNIKLIINRVSQEKYSEISVDKLSTDLSDQIFLTTGSSADNHISAYVGDKQLVGQSIDIVSAIGTSETKVPSQNLVTKLSSEISSIQYGTPGDVLYIDDTGSGILKQQINNYQVLVCETSAEVEECKSEKFSFQTVFDSWTRFGIFNDTYAYQKGIHGAQQGTPGYSGGDRSGLSVWRYDASEDSISQISNTTDFTGYVSTKKYGDYLFTVRCYSAYTDDDLNGIIAAYAYDSDGKSHTISFIRSPNKVQVLSAYHWTCMLDAKNIFDLTSSDYGQRVLKNSDLNSTTEPLSGWSYYQNGVLVSVRREGNKFYGRTSEFSDTDPLHPEDLEYDLSIDLDDIQAKTPELSAINLFINKPTQIGYCTYSQPSSYYENIEFADANKLILDLPNDKVLEYDKTNANWRVISGTTCIEKMGIGRLSYNNVTEKLFYNDGNNIFRIRAT